MTHSSFPALSVLAVTAFLSGSAAAQEVRIDVRGKSDFAARADIRKAVEDVCRAADRDGAFQGAYRLQNCLMDGEARAVRELKAYRRQVAHTSPSELARNRPFDVRR